jgi:hypothetical protein
MAKNSTVARSENLERATGGRCCKIQGMDARLDGKRKMIMTSQSLYLTPRSRGGAFRRAPEEPKSEMDKMLDGKKEKQKR